MQLAEEADPREKQELVAGADSSQDEDRLQRSLMIRPMVITKGSHQCYGVLIVIRQNPEGALETASLPSEPGVPHFQLVD